MLTRLRRAVEEGRKAAAGLSEKAAYDRSGMHWALLHIDDSAPPGDAIDRHHAFCQAAGLGCLVVSNHYDTLLLARPEIRFEFAPLDVRAVHDMDRDARLAGLYLQDRLLHIVTFWKVLGCNWSGSRANEVRRLAAASMPELAAIVAPGEPNALKTEPSML